MQLILHYDETYREVKYGTLGLEDIDNKMLMGINVTPIVGLLYTPVLIRLSLCLSLHSCFGRNPHATHVFPFCSFRLVLWTFVTHRHNY